MESNETRTHYEPDGAGARAALEDVESARHDLAAGIAYPSSYRPLMAFSGAAIPLLMASGSDGVPSTFVGGLLLVVGLLGVIASGWALSVFESANGVRITGLRSGKRLSFAYLAAAIGLLIVVAGIAHATDAWWVVLVAAPISAAISVVYVNAWLTDYRRHVA